MSTSELRVECRTVGELIAVLQQFPAETVPFSYEPPFTGCLVVEQSNGRIMIASPDRSADDASLARPKPSSDRMAVGE